MWPLCRMKHKYTHCPFLYKAVTHRVGRVLSFFSSRQNWVSPNPSPASKCAPLPFGPGGEGTLACGRGVGGVLIPTRGHTLWCSTYIYKNFVLSPYSIMYLRLHPLSSLLICFKVPHLSLFLYFLYLPPPQLLLIKLMTIQYALSYSVYVLYLAGEHPPPPPKTLPKFMGV